MFFLPPCRSMRGGARSQFSINMAVISNPPILGKTFQYSFFDIFNACAQCYFEKSWFYRGKSVLKKIFSKSSELHFKFIRNIWYFFQFNKDYKPFEKIENFNPI